MKCMTQFFSLRWTRSVLDI